MLHHTGSICWLTSPDVAGTLVRARGYGQPTWGVVSGLLKATIAGRHSDQSRLLVMHLDGAGQFKFLASSLRGTVRALGDRVCGLEADVE